MVSCIGGASENDCLPDFLIDIEVAIGRLVPAQLVSLLLQHVVQDLHPQEQLLIFLLEVLLSQYLEGIFVREWLASERVSVLGDLTGDGAHERDWPV